MSLACETPPEGDQEDELVVAFVALVILALFTSGVLAGLLVGGA